MHTIPTDEVVFLEMKYSYYCCSKSVAQTWIDFWNWKLYVMYDLSLNNSSSLVTGWCFQWFGRTHPRLLPVKFFLLTAAAHFSSSTFTSNCSKGCCWVVSIKSSAWCDRAIVPTFDANCSFMGTGFYSMLCCRHNVIALSLYVRDIGRGRSCKTSIYGYSVMCACVGVCMCVLDVYSDGSDE